MAQTCNTLRTGSGCISLQLLVYLGFYGTQTNSSTADVSEDEVNINMMEPDIQWSVHQEKCFKKFYFVCSK